MQGKVAIVTGTGAAGDGIGNGRAAALLLARWGARVLAVDCNAALAARTAEMICEEGGEAVSFAADIASQDQCRALVEAALDQFGRVDMLDNNVGVAPAGSVVDGEYDEWRRAMAINLDGFYLTSKYAIPAMMRTGGGAIVNIASIAGLRPAGGRVAYAASKGG